MFLVRMILVGLFLLSSVSVFAMGRVGAPSINQDSPAGKLAPDFTLPRTDGTSSSIMSARNGKKAILIIWATWCPHCREELVRINNDLENIKAKGIEVILVSEGEGKDRVSEYLMQHHINLESFIDEETALQEPYNVVGVPTLVFIDAKGNILDVDHELPSDYETIFEKK